MLSNSLNLCGRSHNTEEGWRYVIELALKFSTKSVKTENVQVVYNLIFKNTLYSLECYKEKSKEKNINNYCFIEDITDDEGEAEDFLYRMVKGKVFPVHIKDMIEDFFEG